MDYVQPTTQTGAITIEQPFSFSKRSFIGCGGDAPVGYYPKTEEEVKALLNNLNNKREKYVVLGNLSNILPRDENLEASIISTKALREIKTDGNLLYVSAGVSSNALLEKCKTLGVGGIEFLAGIPCSFGGALFMNAGASGEYIAPFVQSVKVIYQDKEIILSKEDCAYAYKSSIFMREKMFILGGTLALPKMSELNFKKRKEYFLSKRAHLPKGRSMGCVFKNPQGDTAGRLIEGAGLKGYRIGGAVVSTKHANFIINDNKATSLDIKKLITLIKSKVFTQYTIQLQEEIRYI